MYYFAFDNKPGDTNAQNSRHVWFVVAPDGTAIVPVVLELPVTGDPAISALVVAGLMGALLLLSVGGLLIVPSRIRR